MKKCRHFRAKSNCSHPVAGSGLYPGPKHLEYLNNIWNYCKIVIFYKHSGAGYNPAPATKFMTIFKGVSSYGEKLIVFHLIFCWTKSVLCL
jgi:hypothetical protein